MFYDLRWVPVTAPIDGSEDIDLAWLERRDAVDITAGASALEILVQQVIKRLRALGGGMSGRMKVVQSM